MFTQDAMIVPDRAFNFGRDLAHHAQQTCFNLLGAFYGRKLGKPTAGSACCPRKVMEPEKLFIGKLLTVAFSSSPCDLTGFCNLWVRILDGKFAQIDGLMTKLVLFAWHIMFEPYAFETSRRIRGCPCPFASLRCVI